MILKEILTQYKNYIYLEDENSYSQLTISNNGVVSHRDIKKGAEIGRKRQFIIDLKTNPHTLIFTRQGVVEGSIGIVPKELDGYIVTENMPMFSINTDFVNPQYLLMFLKSKEYKEQIRKIIPSGTAQKALHEDKWTLIEINLPPLKKQNEIVVKYLNCLPNLEKVILKTSKQEKYVSSLRQAILQQAVEGKLCKQDPSDEPASMLLEKIRAEKDKLIAKKKFKKQKDLPPITEEEKPFELPQGWEWCRLGEVTSIITSGSRDWAKYYSSSGAKFVRMGNLSRGSYELRMSNIQYVLPPTMGEGSRTRLEENDILLSITGEVGLLGLIPREFGEAYINQHTALLRFCNTPTIKYYANTMLSNLCQNQFNAPQRGIKNSFRLSDIEYIIIPLPPLAEQQRIVEKVDRLMALCDELEQEVTSAKKYASQLMEGVLQEAFSSKPEETRSNVVVFAPPPQQEKQSLMAAARGNMKEDTWQRLANRALELANEES